MRIGNPFNEALRNPFVDTMLGANAFAQLVPLFKGADHSQEFINAAEASGQPVTSIPRRGLLSFISPNIQATPDQLNQEKIALQNQGAGRLANDIEMRSVLGPQNYETLRARNPAMFQNLPDFAAPTPMEAERQAMIGQRNQFHQDAVNQQQQNLEERKQEHAESDSLRQQGLAIQQQNTAANLQMKQLMADMQNENRKTTQRIEQERNDDTRRARFDQSVRNLQADQQKASAMLSSANAADPKTVQTLLDRINGRAKSLKDAADKYGYEYDPASFEPLAVNTKKTWGGLSTESSVGPANAAAAPKTEQAKNGSMTSNSGRKIVADATSPTGYRYAD